MIFGSKHLETAKLRPQRITVKRFRSKLAASFSGIVHCSAKHSSLISDERCKEEEDIVIALKRFSVLHLHFQILIFTLIIFAELASFSFGPFNYIQLYSIMIWCH